MLPRARMDTPHQQDIGQRPQPQDYVGPEPSGPDSCALAVRVVVLQPETEENGDR